MIAPKNKPASSSQIGLSKRRKSYDTTMRTLLYGSMAITITLVLFLVGYIFYRGLPALTWEFLSTETSHRNGTEGIFPAIINTVYVIVISLLLILPFGVGAAIYLTEYATNKKLVGAIEFATETLAGIPSIIYALVGMLVFCQFLGLKTSLMAGALTLVIMTLPTIIRTTQESLKTVPTGYREGALALGAGKWHMIRTIVLPVSVDGILTGCILSVGRIVGESAVLLFTAGMSTRMQDFFASPDAFLHSSGATLTVSLYVYAKERAMYDLAFSVAAVLLVITFTINLSAKLVGNRLGKH